MRGDTYLGEGGDACEVLRVAFLGVVVVLLRVICVWKYEGRSVVGLYDRRMRGDVESGKFWLIDNAMNGPSSSYPIIHQNSSI